MARTLSFKNILKPGLIMLIPVFFGCETQGDFGIKYPLEIDANVKYVEFTLPATNIYLDSLRTDGENRILVGNYSDLLTGSVSAEGYFNFTYEKGPLPSAKSSDSSPNPPDTLQIDSVVLILETGAIIPQRGNSFQEFAVHELQDSLQNEAVYLSNLKQTVGVQIGAYSKSINVAHDTLYRLKLSDAFKLNLFQKISEVSKDTDQSITSAVFKSIGLVPGTSSESIASFNLASDTSRLIVYTSPSNPSSKDTTYLTYFRISGKNYTYLDRNRSGSSFAGIEENEDFDLPNNQTLIDPLSGISTAFSLHQLEDFFRDNRRILINNTFVSFEFEAENNRDTLVSFMNFFRKKDKSIFGAATVRNSFDNLVMSDNAYFTFQSDPARGVLNYSKEEISISSTLFYQQLHRQSQDSLSYLVPTTGVVKPINELVLISIGDVTLQRTIFKENGIKLGIYYTEVDQ
ncbi:hypothetical protein [Ekhidna sp.]|uniref:hypothetical protein n=1 Tax=Ekhidna sp. TaxID=2608089 RepID=UPI0032EE2485